MLVCVYGNGLVVLTVFVYTICKQLVDELGTYFVCLLVSTCSLLGLAAKRHIVLFAAPRLRFFVSCLFGTVLCTQGNVVCAHPFYSVFVQMFLVVTYWGCDNVYVSVIV